MKKQLLFFVILSLTLCLTATVTYYPRNVLGEVLTKTTLTGTNIYNGLNQIGFSNTELIKVRYYDNTSGDYGNQATHTAIQAYGNVELPLAVFNGKRIVEENGADVAQGLMYKANMNYYYNAPSPVKIKIVSYNTSTGACSLEVKKLSNESIANAKLHILLVEDQTAEHTNIVRDIKMIDFSASNNDVATFSQTLDTQYVGTANNTYAVAFIKTSEGEIIQSETSKSKPNYFVRTVAPEGKIQFGPSTRYSLGHDFTLFNMGTADTLTVSIHILEAPTGTNLSYCDESSCYFAPTEFTFTSGGTKTFHATIIPNAPGVIKYYFKINSPNLAEPHKIYFSFVTEDIDAVIISDNKWSTPRQFADALDANNKTNFTYDVYQNAFHKDMVDSVKSIIWSKTREDGLIDDYMLNFLKTYLDTNGKLIVSGQSIAKTLHSSNSMLFNQFLSNYLHADYVRENTSQIDIQSVPGSSVTSNLRFSIWGNANQTKPNVIRARSDARNFLKWVNNGSDYAAVRAFHGARSNVAFLSFGFEAIGETSARNQLINGIYNWYENGVYSNDENDTPIAQTLLNQNYPNPFNPSTKITFTLKSDDKKDAVLSIYNILGQKVKEFTNLTTKNNVGSIIWNGKSNDNKSVSSGIYFYKLETKSGALTNKMLLLK